MLHELLLNFLCCFSIFKEVKNRFLISVLDLIMHSHFYFHYNDCPPVVISQKKNRAESSEKTQRIMWKATLWYPFKTETSIFFSTIVNSCYCCCFHFTYLNHRHQHYCYDAHNPLSRVVFSLFCCPVKLLVVVGWWGQRTTFFVFIALLVATRQRT